MPVQNFSVFLDLVFIMKLKLSNVKFFVVGGHFDAMFKYANANIEFLNPILQNKIFSTQP